MMRLRRLSSLSVSLPPVNGCSFVHCAMPVGRIDISLILPAITLPLTPVSTACAGTSTALSPASSVESSVVSKRTPSAVIATVPFSITQSDSAAPGAVKRSAPVALVAGERVMPRVWA